MMGINLEFSDGSRMTANDKAKKALEKAIIGWADVNDVSVEMFDVDETPVDVPGITISGLGGQPAQSYRLVHMYIDNDGDWQLKWVNDE